VELLALSFLSLLSRVSNCNCAYSQRALSCELLETLKFLFEANNLGKLSLNLLSHLLFDSLIKAEFTRSSADLRFCLCANYVHFLFHW
jgi:hypothetical protein